MKCKICGYESEFKWTCPCLWGNDGAPDLYKFAVLDDLKETHAKRLIASYNANGRLLTMFGPTGAGKTHSAWAFTKWLQYNCAYMLPRRIGRPFVIPRIVTFVHGPSLPRLPSELEARLSPLRRAEILIIDEYDNVLYSVLDRRLSEKMPTIVTTNEDISKAFGPRTWDRMRGGAVAFGSASVRGTEQQTSTYAKRSKQADAWSKAMDEKEKEDE